jgi:hypothetical protein
MTDGSEKSDPSVSNNSADSRSGDNSVARAAALPGEQGPGSVTAGLSWFKSRIRDLETDKTIPREEHDLLRLYYTREREKLQLKLHVFSEAERIQMLESRIRREEEVQKTGSERSLVEQAISDAHSELKKASTALQRLSRDDAKWEKQAASARRWQESRKWQAITPEELQPAIEAIRHKIEHNGFWQSNQSTIKLCFAALHPEQPTQSDPESLAPYKRFLVGLLGRRIESSLLISDRPAPMIFKSYLDVLEAAMKSVVRGGFQEMFDVAKLRTDMLGMHPVEWTKRQLDILISAEKSGIQLWIKRVCAPLDSSNAGATEDSIFWGSWRAPRLIHMKPSGNTAYEPATEWVREDLVRSEELLEGLAGRVTTFLRIDLDEAARASHIEFAKQDLARMPLSKQERSAAGNATRRTPPLVSGSQPADVWRSLQETFRELAEEELRLAPRNTGDRWLRAYVDYKDMTIPCGRWHLSEGVNESFHERFAVEATRAGIAVASTVSGEARDVWLHHVFSDLLAHESKLLFAASQEGGIIVRACEASALYCVRLEKQALLEGRRSGVSASKVSVVSSPSNEVGASGQHTTAEDARTETQREAVIKKVQNPHLYNILSILEAALYFDTHSRTIHRWLLKGDLRAGARRGSITIESILKLEKKRSRKRRED